MMFSSKTPRDLNRDPLPWVCPEAHGYDKMPVRHREGLADQIHFGVYRCNGVRRNPRPEYDHPQHNEPNPILVETRKHLSDGGPANAAAIISIRLRTLAWMLEAHETSWERLTDKTVLYIEHARRVLTRLAKEER